MRHYSLIDHLLIQMDTALKSVTGGGESARPSPALSVAQAALSEDHRRHAAGLMRVNHTGEVCAQALYQGHALVSSDPAVKRKMHIAAQEERDHLLWCEDRLHALESHTSYLNPLWYSGAFMMGALTASVGDRFGLGFVQETERQVVEHLNTHLSELPLSDEKSRRVIEQMQKDESDHARMAEKAGAQALPLFLKFAMKCCARVMTTLTYWV